jgi:eukaryotic-like serine/threonine-protein kinase
MLIKFDCPFCGEDLASESSERGHEVDCVECGKEFTIPLDGALEVGNIIDDHILLKQIGEGSMGRIYLAEHLLMGRQVALKTISPQVRFQDGSVDQFMKELQNSAILQHPNIVTTYNAGYKDGVHFITMQYIEGVDLHDVVDRTGRYSEKEVLQIAKDVAEALSYAWSEHHMIHRDIKPENIRKDLKGKFVVMDFGLAMAGGIDDSGYISGTPDFMSPEQVKMGSVDFRTDMYALGLVMLYLLTGKRIFAGDPEEVMQMQVTHQIPRADELLPNVKCSDQLQNMLSVMTAKDPIDRYESWDMLLKTLEDMSSIWDTNTFKMKKMDAAQFLQDKKKKAPRGRPQKSKASRSKNKSRVQQNNTTKKAQRSLKRRRAKKAGTNATPILVGVFVVFCVAIGLIMMLR